MDGQWYRFLADRDGNTIAHYNPALIGKSLQEMLGQSNCRASERGGWVSHRDINPVTGAMAEKHIWVVQHGGLVFSSGWFHDVSLMESRTGVPDRP